MRNLKRALSLTLASVMLLGMMVVGSSAASYPDVAEEDNVEAIEVLQAVGVMEGDNNGNFNPDDYVTREQMAVIMSKLLNLDYNYYQGTNPFSDVPAWAAPYVAACAANGITSGIGGGMYGAGQNVNAVQAALMMLKALGYFQYQQDFGEDYVLATVKQATEIGLFNQIDSKAEQALTRNEVAQMALNALQSDLVRFTGDPGVKYTGSNGESWIGGYKAEYTPRTSTDPKYNRLIDNKHSSNIDYSGQYYCQLGEELYNGDLVKRIDSDIFSRPSYTWTYKTEKIGTYIDREKRLEGYTKGVTGRDLYDLLNNITIRDYDLEIYVDGHEAGNTTTDYTQYNYNGGRADEVFTSGDLKRSNTDDLGITGDGVLTEVWLDRDNEIITVTSIHTWLAQATSSYSETRESAVMKIFMTSATGTSKTVNVENVPEVDTVAADTFYLVTMSDKDTSKLEVAAISEPEILTQSTITKFSNGKKTSTETAYPTKLTVDGTEYNDSDRAIYDADTLNQYAQDLLTTNTYNVYLDKYGYFIGVDLYEGTKQYVFITGYDMRNSNLSVKTAEAAGIFLDGTMDSITVNVKDTNDNIKNMVSNKGNTNAMAYYQQWGSNASDGVFVLNRWYTYTENNGVYTLRPCVDKDGNAMMLAAKTDNAADGELKMNTAKLRLDGVDDNEALLMGETMTYVNSSVQIGAAATPKFDLTSMRAYGEDASVFITVDVDNVSGSFVGSGNGKGAITRAITDVNGVYTGVQDVDIITKTSNRITGDYLVAKGGAKAESPTNDWTSKSDVATNPKNNFISDGAGYSYLGENAYAVFDKNNFIIGAVILGEAVGNNNTKAYILDPVKYERYENGTYYWQFEAIINGEKVTQEAESKFSSTIDRMRNNQYEIVELRYNSNDVVTDVKAINRTDVASNLTAAADEIYGYPFGEILTGGHKVEDNETIYDVVVTGPKDADQRANQQDGTTMEDVTTFKYVTRPRMGNSVTEGNPVEHNYRLGTSGSWGNWMSKTFKTTNKDRITGDGVVATLNLQGRTLYLHAAQDDYGIDFTRDAKAVVIQPEGYTDTNGVKHYSMETRTYTTVQEAVDNLGDDNNDTTDGKQFRGIITAVLTSAGNAEWIVFYSDVEVDTRNDTAISGATMPVDVKYELRDGNNNVVYAETYKTVYLEGQNNTSVNVPSPTVINNNASPFAGYTCSVSSVPLMWEKNVHKQVTFVYYPVGGGNPGTGEKVGYVFDFKCGTNAAFGTSTGSVATSNGIGIVNTATEQTIKDALDAYNTKNGTYWEIDTASAPTQYLASASATPIDVPVKWQTTKIKVPAALTAGDLQVAYAADTTKGITALTATDISVAGISVPKGVDLTISGSKAGKYNKDGEAINTMNITTETTLGTDDYGYYKVTMDGTTPIDGTVTNINMTGATATIANGAAYVKSAADAKVDVTVTVKSSGAVTADTIKAMATAVTGSITATPSTAAAQTHAKADAADETITFTVEVGVPSTAADVTLKITLS